VIVGDDIAIRSHRLADAGAAIMTVESQVGPLEMMPDSHEGGDALLAALAAAEIDDEPFTDEDRKAADAGWRAYLAGDSSPLAEVRRRLSAEDEAEDS
jgi:hypothetical protein